MFVTVKVVSGREGDVTPCGMWKMYIAPKPIYQTIWYHIPEDSNFHCECGFPSQYSYSLRGDENVTFFNV
jgi:hypothetical protein